jgi:hypothetical protein
MIERRQSGVGDLSLPRFFRFLPHMPREGLWKLAGGGAERNHRYFATHNRALVRALDQAWLSGDPRSGVPAGTRASFSTHPGGYAPLHHRLISTAPPGAKQEALVLLKTELHGVRRLSRRSHYDINQTAPCQTRRQKDGQSIEAYGIVLSAGG